MICCILLRQAEQLMDHIINILVQFRIYILSQVRQKLYCANTQQTFCTRDGLK